MTHFVYTISGERRELLELLKEREWFTSSGVKAYIPKHQQAGEECITRQYTKTLHRTHKLENDWRRIEERYFAIVAKFRGGMILKHYQVQMTVFGCEGQYRPPRTVLIRLRSRRDDKTACETIGHELLHLIFHNFFKQKRMNYEYREGMVDMMIMRSELRVLFPKYVSQPIGKIRPKILARIIGE